MKNLSRIQLELVADCILAKMNDLNHAKSTVLKPETHDAIQKEIDNLHNILDIVCDNAAGKEYCYHWDHIKVALCTHHDT